MFYFVFGYQIILFSCYIVNYGIIYCQKNESGVFMSLLDNLDKLMKQNKMNRTELAKRVGIAPSTINSWYSRGYENVTLKALLKISAYFNVSIEELVNDNPVQELTFTSNEFSLSELQAIYEFGEFLKSKRGEIEE